MSDCLLCNAREATKTGSQIIPSFFMKRINSIDGCNERDHEVGFSIGLGTVETYFGREVYEDRRREYTDDEARIEDRTNLDTKDNVFCPVCEKLFSKFESKYSQTYQLPFDKELINNTKVIGPEAALFWYSVFWRVSATEHFNVRLHPGFEEKLRRLVVSENTSEGDVYNSVFYCKGYRDDNPTFALFDCANDVALLIVDEFMVVLFNGVEATRNEEELWGMIFQSDVTNLNNGDGLEKIGLIPLPIFRLINENIFHRALRRIDFRGKFDALHKLLFNVEMSDSLYQELMDEIQKAKIADRFTVENYMNAFRKIVLSRNF